MTYDELRAYAISEEEIDQIFSGVRTARASTALRLRSLIPIERVLELLDAERTRARPRTHGEAFADELDALDQERELERARSGRSVADDDDLA